MSKGMSLQELAVELERQKNAKRDFMADTKELRVEPNEASPTNLSLHIGQQDQFPINKHAVRQIGARLEIPAKYVDRLAEKHPDLLAWNVNTLFEREPETRMVRVLDDNVRAFLSERFRPLDNFDFANAVLPKLIETGCEVKSCEITESRLYIKAFRPGVEREIKKPGTHMGDGGHNVIHKLRPGLCLSNSEVGAGSMAVQPGVDEEWCSNLALFSKNAMKKYHVGRKQGNDQESMWEIFTDATKRASDKAFWLQVADLVDASLDGDLFEQMVAECEAKMLGTEIVKPSVAIKELANLSETEEEGILAELIKGGDLSQFGMQYAVTRFAQARDVSYDRQVELEQLGGNIIELPTKDWERIALAA